MKSFFSVLIALITMPILSAGQINVLTQHNDNGRTGANLSERALNTSNVNARQFGKLFSRTVDGQIYAQPLYVANVSLPNCGTRNVVYVATEHNSVYAFDADDPAESEPLWRVNLGPSAPIPNDEFGNRYHPDHNLLPELGITGTPVIDLGTNTLYVVAFTKEFNTYHQRLHALDITTGQEKFNGPVAIQGSVAGTGYDQIGGRIRFDAAQTLQRPGLLLSSGILYIAFASHKDTDPYHGWVFAYDARTLQQLGVFSTTPNGNEGGIWQAGQGPVADSDGYVYFMTGNGSFNADIDGPNYGDSFAKLGLSKDGLSVVDWFAPCNQCCLERADADLGSAGPLLLPGTRLLLGGGKQGRLYLLNIDNMGHFQGGQIGMGCPSADCNRCVDDQIVQRFQATGGIHGSPVYWASPNGPMIYVMGAGDQVKAFQMINGQFNTTPASQSNVPQSERHFPGGILSLSANESEPGTGILWVAASNATNIHNTQTGVLRAFDASDLSRELWNSKQNEAFDGIGNNAKFNPPTIANGKVYMPSFSGQLHVFGLLPNSPPPLVRITAPTTRTTLAAPFDIIADALSRDDSIARVDFYAGGTRIGGAETPPYRIVWKDAPVGRYTLTGVAADRHGNMAASEPVEVTVANEAMAIGRIIGINFIGGGVNRPEFMEPYETAGAWSRSIWNNAPNRGISPNWFKSGWLSSLFDDSGWLTGARMAWSASGVFSTSIPDEPGNHRMMKGYLDTWNTSTTYVIVYDLPESFTSNGYDVYVYFDGENGATSRTANYKIGTTIVSGTDAAGVNFSGTFAQAIAGSEGNYVVFPGLTEDRFVLEATPGDSSDNTQRAPINGIQIVARRESKAR